MTCDNSCEKCHPVPVPYVWLSTEHMTGDFFLCWDKPEALRTLPDPKQWSNLDASDERVHVTLKDLDDHDNPREHTIIRLPVIGGILGPDLYCIQETHTEGFRWSLYGDIHLVATELRIWARTYPDGKPREYPDHIKGSDILRTIDEGHGITFEISRPSVSGSDWCEVHALPTPGHNYIPKE